MSGRPTIRPHLWFDTEARQAAEFYCALFPDSAVEHLGVVRDTPSGDCDVVYFRLAGQPFMAISAGPAFRFTQAQESLDATWAQLVEGGTVLMPLDAYPFSPRYGWVQDRFGLSWQLILSDSGGEPRPFITPSLLFTGAVCGKAEEAAALYREVFEGSKLGQLARYPAGMTPDREGTVMYMDFRLGDTWFAAMDSARGHAFGFSGARGRGVRLVQGPLRRVLAGGAGRDAGADAQ
jgi:predicted 3-demethylubiquinone-9 3-methyltransferase (glyoxalase superfamily)